MKSPSLILAAMLAALLFHTLPSPTHAAPDAKKLGAILGYPAENLTVEDITDEERILWRTPTARERNRSTPLPDSNTLLAAYKVTAKDPATFFPVKMWIGEKGAFLNAEASEIIVILFYQVRR